MKTFARAVSDEQKHARRRIVLDSALEIFEQFDYKNINMADIAKKTGIAKGSVFLYFKTKEELFMNLLAEQLQKWNDEYDQDLVAVENNSLDFSGLIQIFVGSLMNHPNLVKLVSFINNIFGENLSHDQVAIFKKVFIERIRRTGGLLEEKVSFFNQGDGEQFYLHCYILVTGLANISNPVPVIKEVVQSPDYGLLNINFKEYLRDMLTLILEGMKNKQESKEEKT